MAQLTERAITYKDGDVELEGFLIFDPKRATSASKAPGVMVIHQYMGLTDYEKKRARMLANLGYVAFACDIYGKTSRPKNAEEAGAAAGKYKGDLTTFRRRLNLGLDVLKSQTNVDAKKLGAIGYCFGGTGALELARSGADVQAVVSFHGALSTANPADAAKIKGSVLVCHGAVDPLVPPAEVAAFQKEMEDAKVDYQFVAYAGAKHSFTQEAAGNNPGSPVAYNANADRRSWAAMVLFFVEAFLK